MIGDKWTVIQTIIPSELEFYDVGSKKSVIPMHDLTIYRDNSIFKIIDVKTEDITTDTYAITYEEIEIENPDLEIFVTVDVPILGKSTHKWIVKGEVFDILGFEDQMRIALVDSAADAARASITDILRKQDDRYSLHGLRDILLNKRINEKITEGI
jgi:hypothetical protein